LLPFPPPQAENEGAFLVVDPLPFPVIVPTENEFLLLQVVLRQFALGEKPGRDHPISLVFGPLHLHQFLPGEEAGIGEQSLVNLSQVVGGEPGIADPPLSLFPFRQGKKSNNLLQNLVADLDGRKKRRRSRIEQLAAEPPQGETGGQGLLADRRSPLLVMRPRRSPLVDQLEQLVQALLEVGA